MIRLFQILCIALISSNVIGQNAGSFTLSIKWNSNKYLFYETFDLKKIEFQIQDLSEKDKSKWLEYSNKIIKKISLKKSNLSNVLLGTLYFKNSPTAEEARLILEQLGVTEFYLNKKRILTKGLISINEKDSLIRNFKPEINLFTTDCNDTTKIQYYNFQIYHAKSKLVYMWEGNYPKYLYDGYVTKFMELLEKSEKNKIIFQNKFKK